MIAFFSNFINEHQIPFCNAMYRETGEAFRFVATQPVDEERLKMGFRDQSGDFPYVVKSYTDSAGYQEAMRLGLESDVVIIGSAPDCFIEERMKQNKLTFRYYERFFKEGRWRILDPRVLWAHYKQDFRFRKKNLYMLCASAYTAPDCRFIHCYPNKTYKWGYFPPVKKYDNIDSLIGLKHPASILWAGRLIGLKHPEDAVLAAEKLRKAGYDFSLDFIGDGDLRPKLESMIAGRGLTENVHILGFMPPEKVREHMERSDIYLFTSDRNEGWGAVLNESMNSACAVVANREIGSVPYLIRDGVNGLMYDRKQKNLYEKVKSLLDDGTLKRNLQRNAYETLISEWNADAASKRLLVLIDCIQNKKTVPYMDGPCSEEW